MTTDRRIAAISDPHGIVSHWQLRDVGLGRGAIRYRVEIGRLYPIHSGVYAVGHPPVSPLAYAMAAVLACGPGAVLSHRSAATLWGVDHDWHSPLEVTAPSKHRHRRLRVHCSRTLTAREVTVHYGIPVTSPARTVFDNASRLGDVALGRAVNDLRRAGYLSLADLAELLSRHPAKRLITFVAHPERAPTRSEFEDAFLLFAERFGLPEPLVNTQVAGHEADIFFPEHKLVVELDGYEDHGRRAHFESDRDRDADLLAVGIPTVRVTWARFTLKTAQEAARLHAILGQRAPSAP